MSESCCTTVEEPKSKVLYEYLKFAGLILAITLASLVSHRIWDSAEWMQHFMGWFLIAFAVFKLIGYAAFRSGFQTYDLIASRLPVYATAFPFIELALGAALLFNVATTPALVLTLVIMAIGAAGIAVFLASGKKASCACLGGVIDLPLSTVSLFEANLMAHMALWMLLV